MGDYSLPQGLCMSQSVLGNHSSQRPRCLCLLLWLPPSCLHLLIVRLQGGYKTNPRAFFIWGQWPQATGLVARRVSQKDRGPSTPSHQGDTQADPRSHTAQETCKPVASVQECLVSSRPLNGTEFGRGSYKSRHHPGQITVAGHPVGRAGPQATTPARARDGVNLSQ